ncbi:MAG: hypothetical protein JWL69_1646, partial [Phycisphaerales bacterium]|nr:hypothetical protein [Phycisphaerales bacterium]
MRRTPGARKDLKKRAGAPVLDAEREKDASGGVTLNLRLPLRCHENLLDSPLDFHEALQQILSQFGG